MLRVRHTQRDGKEHPCVQWIYGSVQRRRLDFRAATEAMNLNGLVEQTELRLTANWHAAHWIRLLLGLVVCFQAVYASDGLLGVVAAFLLLQAFTNTGCCGTTCAVNPIAKPDVSAIDKQFGNAVVDNSKD
jgi:hypothetical protein